MRKYCFITCLCLILFLQNACIADNSKKDAKFIQKQNYEKLRECEKKSLYKKLGLSQTQIQKAELIDLKYKSQKREAVKELYDDSNDLKNLKTQHSASLKVKLKEIEVKASYRHAKRHFKQAQNDFEEILTREQKNIYNEYLQERKQHLINKKLQLTGIDK